MILKLVLFNHFLHENKQGKSEGFDTYSNLIQIADFSAHMT